MCTACTDASCACLLHHFLNEHTRIQPCLDAESSMQSHSASQQHSGSKLSRGLLELVHFDRVMLCSDVLTAQVACELAMPSTDNCVVTFYRLSASTSATQPPGDAVAPIRMRGSRSLTVHANPLWADADHQLTPLAHQPQPNVKQPQLVLARQHTADDQHIADGQHSADGQHGAHGQADLHVTHTKLKYRPVPESPTPQQMPQLSLQRAEVADNMSGSSRQHVSSCVTKQSRSSPTTGSPQSARSSQSDATHLDHLDGHISERHWQEAQQPSVAGLSSSDDASLPSTSGCLTPDSQTALGRRAERWVNNQMLTHDAAGTSYSEYEASLSGYSVSANPLAWSIEDEQSPR